MTYEKSPIRSVSTAVVGAGAIFVFFKVFIVLLIVLGHILKGLYELTKGILIYLRWRIFDGKLLPADEEVVEVNSSVPILSPEKSASEGTIDVLVEFNGKYDATNPANILAISKDTVPSLNLDAGDIIVVNTEKKPIDGDLVIIGDRLRRYEVGNTLLEASRGVVLHFISPTHIN